MTTSMTAMAVPAPGRRVTAVEVPLPEPGPGAVRVNVEASGVCFADLGTAGSEKSTYGFPLTPGHEVAGTISAVGAEVTGWEVGDRVAVGWLGGSCGQCAACRTGDPVYCRQRQTPGVDYPGGWAESLVAPVSALARIPDGLGFTEAAPMGCAGVTVFNAIRRANLPAGATVAVFGIGGLGHLALQFASAMGHRVVAIARGAEREELARRLGAVAYVDSTVEDVPAALQELGGADLVVSTASSTAQVSELVRGLRTGGRLTLVGVDGGTVQIPAATLVMNGITVTGSLTGSPQDIEEAMAFAVLSGVKPMIDVVPLTDASAAVDRLASGEARFRMVLEVTG